MCVHCGRCAGRSTRRGRPPRDRRLSLLVVVGVFAGVKDNSSVSCVVRTLNAPCLARTLPCWWIFLNHIPHCVYFALSAGWLFACLHMRAHSGRRRSRSMGSCRCHFRHHSSPCRLIARRSDPTVSAREWRGAAHTRATTDKGGVHRLAGKAGIDCPAN